MVLAESCFELNWIELDGVWVRALSGPTHLGLRTGPLCPMFCTKLEESCSFNKVADGRYISFPDILRVQKERTQICMSEWSQGSTLTQNVDWVFLLSTTFPTSGFITQLHYIKMSSLGVMSSKEANNKPGLCPIKDNESCLISIRNLKLSEKTNIFIISH